jgi:hypothetical protein
VITMPAWVLAIIIMTALLSGFLFCRFVMWIDSRYEIVRKEKP